jgi:hypothetical protein
MTTYTGENHEIRVGTSAVLASGSAALPYFDSLDWKVARGRKHRALGIGSNLTEVQEGLIEYTGSAKFRIDETDVGGGSEPIALALEADVTGTRTPLYIEIKNTKTGSIVMLSECLGDYNESIPSVDGEKTGTYDFGFNSISFSYP